MGVLVTVVVREEPFSQLPEHAAIPISYRVDRVLDVTLQTRGLGGIVLREVEVGNPWVKDHDAGDGGAPTGWVKRFDVTNWGLLAAFRGDARVGGAVIARRTPGLDLLGGRDDLAVLWDLRVRPDVRRTGVGASLFRRAQAWARVRDCRELIVETQNINVPACRFYVRMGCQLASINRLAYPGLPGEVQFLWSRDL
jgi:GNAT superfamily N-acetyltransferase